MNGGARTLVSTWQRPRRSVQTSTRPHLAYGPIPCFCIPRRRLWIPWRCLGNPRRCLPQLRLHPHRPLRAERPPSPQLLPAPITHVMYSMSLPLIRTLCSGSSDDGHTREDSSLWQWVICYARFQCAAQLLIDAFVEGPAGFLDIETCFQVCQRTLNAMSSAAPRSDLEDCRTKKGATWQSIVHCFVCTLRHGMTRS